MDKIKIAIAGVGNCASSLIQGIEYYRPGNGKDPVGLMHREIGGYGPSDIQIVAAFDIDERKVGQEVTEAIFQPPNCTAVFQSRIPKSGVSVSMGRVLDGVSAHMRRYEPSHTFVVSSRKEAAKEDIVSVLKESGVPRVARS